MSTATNLMNRPSDQTLVELKQTPRGTGETAVVRAEHLSKRFGDLLAVDDLTFSLERGTVTGFLGPNGAGKTTTLRMLLHLVQPSAGHALVFGRRYQDLERPAAQVGAVLEAADFHPGRSGRDHLFSLALALGRGAKGGHWFLERERAAAKRVDAVLDLVELRSAGRRRVGSYSLGMRQRLGLAAALLGNPALLILDEPANGLDPEGVRWLRDFLRGFAADGKTVLVSSHVLAEVAQTVDDVIIINKGRLVTISPLAELIARRTGAVHVRAPAHTTAGQARNRRAPVDTARRRRTAGGGRAKRPRRRDRLSSWHAARRTRAGIVEPRGRVPRADRGGAVMTDQLLAELRKMRSTRTNLGLLAGMIALILLTVLLNGFIPKAHELTTHDNQHALLSAGTSAALFAALIGVMAITSEFRHGTIRPTFVVTPQRTRVITAKVIASLLMGAAFGLVAIGLSLGVGYAISRHPRHPARTRNRTRGLARTRHTGDDGGVGCARRRPRRGVA